MYCLFFSNELDLISIIIYLVFYITNSVPTGEQLVDKQLLMAKKKVFTDCWSTVLFVENILIRSAWYIRTNFDE